jgi:hypothetical protein
MGLADEREGATSASSLMNGSSAKGAKWAPSNS